MLVITQYLEILGRINYFLQTMPNIKYKLAPVDNEIGNTFIPSLIENRACNNDKCFLLSLPCKLCGLSIVNDFDVILNSTPLQR